MKLPAVLTEGEDGYIVAEIPVLPACISQGRTKEEALANIKEAAGLCVESMREDGWTLRKEYILDGVEARASCRGAWIDRHHCEGDYNHVFERSPNWEEESRKLREEAMRRSRSVVALAKPFGQKLEAAFLQDHD